MQKLEDYEILDILYHALRPIEGGSEAMERAKEAFKVLHEKESVK